MKNGIHTTSTWLSLSFLAACGAGSQQTAPAVAPLATSGTSVALPHLETLPEVADADVAGHEQRCSDLHAGDSLSVTRPSGRIAVWRDGHVVCVDTEAAITRELGKMLAEGTHDARGRDASAKTTAAATSAAEEPTPQPNEPNPAIAMKPTPVTEPTPQPNKPTPSLPGPPSEPTPQPNRPNRFGPDR
ncbi:MAG: hypothetical protein R3A78_06980 [Polyangiales bacterium]